MVQMTCEGELKASFSTVEMVVQTSICRLAVEYMVDMYVTVSNAQCILYYMHFAASLKAKVGQRPAGHEVWTCSGRDERKCIGGVFILHFSFLDVFCMVACSVGDMHNTYNAKRQCIRLSPTDSIYFGDAKACLHVRCKMDSCFAFPHLQHHT
jgi:hypothetical protein